MAGATGERDGRVRGKKTPTIYGPTGDVGV